MHDYSQDKLNKQKYVLSYERLGDNLYLKLANNNTIAINYSEDNEKEIISRMEKQARYAEPKLKAYLYEKIMAVSTTTTFVYFLVSFLIKLNYVYAAFALLSAVFSFAYVTDVIVNLIEKKDIKKLNYFLDNKQELNDGIEKTIGANLNLSKKTIRRIENEYDKKKLKPETEMFNINNIDNYSLKDLKKIKEYLDLYNCYQDDDLLKQGKIVSGPVLKKTNKKR